MCSYSFWRERFKRLIKGKHANELYTGRKQHVPVCRHYLPLIQIFTVYIETLNYKLISVEWIIMSDKVDTVNLCFKK